ncbi:replication restart helicase PriA [Thermosipho atlanticus]|uniref:Replication restart protein PriA n=1 Tax=Thermosipho atlanticus DSM 15807 TaxID=1123380 RepID=A0A1M5RTP4_9BACT|nr:primosomal protein N' [Thermosipho atlanticus]SHH29682.1 replication restart DNA helicase PriA [Thermosipho atlanticus DSM 15807]
MVYEIALSGFSSNKTFLYSYDTHLEIGERVYVTYNGKKNVGYVVEKKEASGRYKEILNKIDGRSFLPEWYVKVIKEISNIYSSPIGKLLDLSFPNNIEDYFVNKVKAISPLYPIEELSEQDFVKKYGEKKLNELVRNGIVKIEKDLKVRKPRPQREIYVYLDSSLKEISEKRLTKKQEKVINYILSRESATYSELRDIFGISKDTLLQLERKRVIKLYEHPIENNKRKVELTQSQREIVNDIIKKHGKHLLMGVTGSGKTEIYLAVMEYYLKFGRVLYLVPETSLIEQTFSRIKSRFPELNIGIYHSYLTKSKKTDVWLKSVTGEVDILLGTRSAIFVPLKDLNLVIVDEEHDDSYYQDSEPIYDAISILERYPQTVIFGSATPRLEHYYAAKNGEFYFHYLTDRFGTVLPEVEIIDLNTEEKITPHISKKMLDEINFELGKGNSVITFVRRKGFSLLMCQRCGYFVKCPNCDVALTYHKDEGKLKCHICGHTQNVINVCPSCGSVMLLEKGTGTERMEKELMQFFPGRVITRADTEIIKRPNLFNDVIKSLLNGELDILVGTKMITKGLDIPTISLIVVTDIDAIYKLPDYNSEIKAFQLLVQVIGRSGRRTKGKALIQTYNPESEVIRYAIEQDVVTFYDIELNKRKKLNYPPFSDIVQVITFSSDKELGYASTTKLVDEIRKKIDDEIIGPTEYLIPKMRNNYLHHFVIKTKDVKKVNKILNQVLLNYPTKAIIRVNPPSLLTYVR